MRVLGPAYRTQQLTHSLVSSPPTHPPTIHPSSRTPTNPRVRPPPRPPLAHNHNSAVLSPVRAAGFSECSTRPSAGAARMAPMSTSTEMPFATCSAPAARVLAGAATPPLPTSTRPLLRGLLPPREVARTWAATKTPGVGSFRLPRTMQTQISPLRLVCE